MGSLSHFESSFNDVGWLIPPYISMGPLSTLAAKIHARGSSFTQDELEQELQKFYDAAGLAAMVTERYPIVPIINEYKDTIAEAIEAHFFGLNHVAVGGLVPVIEGVSRRLMDVRNMKPERHIKEAMVALASSCRDECRAKGWGNIGELESMLDSFAHFATNYLYVKSSHYPFGDGTNRHGIAHGAFSDSDYGRPLNFYKIIAAVDFLTFVAAMSKNISWLAPSPTQRSMQLMDYYFALLQLRKQRIC